jgi:hypothetical protein
MERSELDFKRSFSGILLVSSQRTITTNSGRFGCSRMVILCGIWTNWQCGSIQASFNWEWYDCISEDGFINPPKNKQLSSDRKSTTDYTRIQVLSLLKGKQMHRSIALYLGIEGRSPRCPTPNYAQNLSSGPVNSNANYLD